MNAEPRKTAAELSQELSDAVRLADWLCKMETSLEEQLKEIRLKKREMFGAYHDDGILKILRQKVKAAERFEFDAPIPPIVWKVRPYWGKEEDEYVFVKKTAKRIYVRKRGEESEKYFQLDGTSPSKYDGVIDVKASGIG